MDFTQAQTNVVRAVAGALPADAWQAVILDYEIREVSGGFDSDYVGIVLIPGNDGQLRQDQFQLDKAARDACTELYLQRKRGAGDMIAGFVLRIEQPGAFQFDFKDQIKRLDGVWDAEAEQYLDKYLEHYQREKAPGTTG